MRCILLSVMLCACSFEPGALPTADAIADSPDAIVPTWLIDTASGKAVPETGSQWTDLATAYGLTIGPPMHVWLMQELSGMLADSVGPATLAPLAQPSYQHIVAGWNRRAVGTPELTGDRGFGTAVTGNLDGTPYLLLGYIAVTATPASERSLVGVGSQSDHRFVTITPTGVLRANGLGAVSPVAGTMPFGNVVHPVALKVDPSQTEYVVYTDEERISTPWTPTSGQGGLVFWGAATLGAASARYLYGALWSGASAQLDDAAVKRLLQCLGWTVTGY